MTVTLRPVRAGDTEWLDGWLASAAAALGYDLGHEADGPTRMIIARHGDRVGVAIWREPAPTRAIIELIATPPEYARRGSGMQAAVLLEARLRKRGVREIYAPVSASHGIAMYFWIRLGYGPLLRADWPCDRDGVAWLMRALA